MLKFEDMSKQKSNYERKHQSDNTIGPVASDSLYKLRTTFFKQSSSIKMKRRTNSLVYQHLASFKALNVPKSHGSNTKQITVEGSSSSDEDPKTK